jgi:hypothetical protein
MRILAYAPLRLKDRLVDSNHDSTRVFQYFAVSSYVIIVHMFVKIKAGMGSNTDREGHQVMSTNEKKS